MELEQLAGWLWCLRTPIVQAYAVRERDGFNLIDTSTAGQDDAILAALATLDAEVACFGHGEPLRSDAAARLAQALSRL
jgi:hypothetical protein